MKPVRTFTVVPSLPEPLARLRDVAWNLRWSWDPDSIALLRRLAGPLWEACGHDPVRMLGAIDQRRLDEAATDEGFLTHLARVAASLDAYMADDKAWFRRIHASGELPAIAYFSAEFGVTDCLRTYAGGLGMLAGDYLKSGSDLGLPLTGVGLLYQRGYFHQSLNDAGWQQEHYVESDFHTQPLFLERGADGKPLTISVPHPGREVLARVWRAQVGHVPLYLLDTNVAENWPEDRAITGQLYGGDVETRLRQEIVLGIGGCRALAALGLQPSIYHMNEGHSAFLALERIRHFMQHEGLAFKEASEAASAGLIFTTHTPVPAGHDTFPPPLFERYLGNYAGQLGLDARGLLALGRVDPQNDHEVFGMTVLALRMASASNGVSRLHGQVSRQMWRGLWPEVPEDELPIGHVTNGVHLRSWVSHELDNYYDRYIGPHWREDAIDGETWKHVHDIPDEELWNVHVQRRTSLITFARRGLRWQLQRRNASRADIDRAATVLDPQALTIGFARRFATYKRATLLFRDVERLARVLNDPERPVQIIFAGKAHPRDDTGKELIRQIVTLAREERFRDRIVFLEDYEPAVARFMVQGCDVWLNNPRRPMEASGTSGMKAAANGVLNISTLDGWWDEVWPASTELPVPIGWTIGDDEEYADWAEQDHTESDALLDVLEHDVVPLFYTRDANGLPAEWVARMKACIETICPFFTSHRMVHDYCERFYLPAAGRVDRLLGDGMAGVKAFAEWKERVTHAWPQVRVMPVDAGVQLVDVPAGQPVELRARVFLGALSPSDVCVQLYMGRVNPAGEITSDGATIVSMQPIARDAEGAHIYAVEAAPRQSSGLHGLTYRVLPQHDLLASPFRPGLITWATEGI